MFLPRDRYELLVVFVCGCDAATGGRLLSGFQEWVVAEITDLPASSTAWPWIVAATQVPGLISEALGHQGSLADLADEIDEAAKNSLYDLLEKFLTGRGELDCNETRDPSLRLPRTAVTLFSM